MTRHLVFQGAVQRNARKDFPGKGHFHGKVAWVSKADEGFIESAIRGMPGSMKKLIDKEDGRQAHKASDA